MVLGIISFLLFVVTLVFVIWQPRGLSIAWPAVAGAVLALITGVVSLADVWEVTRIVWNATISLIGIIVISLILDEIGFFEWSALHMARLARGNGRLMFVYMVILGALVSALFTNDGGVLILTPIVLAQVRALKLPPHMVLAYILACGFVADSTSLPFVVSNLVNILSADFFRIGFGEYAARMVVPNLFSIIASLGVLLIFFRKSIPLRYELAHLPEPVSVLKDRSLFRLSWVILSVLFLGFFLSEWMGIPVSACITLAAVVFFVAARRSQSIETGRIWREAPWVVVIFSIGMYVVVWGLHNSGFTELVAGLIRFFSEQGLYAATLGMGYLAAFLSSLMNNLPTVMFDALAIEQAQTSGLVREALIYANVIGSDLGPKMTPIGSLATLIWLHVLGRKGVQIDWWTYMKTGIVLTIPTLFITLTGLYLTLRFL
ncbi:arsenic transporter [Brevibacillus migulae]|uniref:arsenic transporter n=1 Tax=Brevibacillus migulae TaxID=1644114 RepID=UPI00106ED4FD|nr:arsenic transporter [Brevibacillus migulae]